MLNHHLSNSILTPSKSILASGFSDDENMAQTAAMAPALSSRRKLISPEFLYLLMLSISELSVLPLSLSHLTIFSTIIEDSRPLSEYAKSLK